MDFPVGSSARRIIPPKMQRSSGHHELFCILFRAIFQLYKTVLKVAANSPQTTHLSLSEKVQFSQGKSLNLQQKEEDTSIFSQRK
jgi:hypothetical protein